MPTVLLQAPPVDSAPPPTLKKTLGGVPDALQRALGDLSGLGDGLGPIGLTIGGIVQVGGCVYCAGSACCGLKHLPHDP